MGRGQDYIDRRELFTGCQPVRLYAEVVDAKRTTDLTEDRIRTMAESRLRAARLFADEYSDVALLISVHVAGQAFSSDVSLRQDVYLRQGQTWPGPGLQFLHEPLTPLELSGDFGSASTWQDRITGTHGGDGGYILQGVSEQLDRFVLEYLRVNEEACERR